MLVKQCLEPLNQPFFDGLYYMIIPTICGKMGDGLMVYYCFTHITTNSKPISPKLIEPVKFLCSMSGRNTLIPSQVAYNGI